MIRGVPVDFELAAIAGLFSPDKVDYTLLHWKDDIKDFQTEHMEIKFYVPKSRLDELGRYYYTMANPDDLKLENYTPSDLVGVDIGPVHFVFEEIQKEY